MVSDFYSYKLKRGFSTFLTFFLFLGFFVPTGFAQTTAATATADVSVETVIIVNGGDKSTYDAAIASAIAEDIGAYVLYTEHDDASVELLNELKELEPTN